MAPDAGSYLVSLHQLLFKHFNLDEIRMLCFTLNIDYESVGGSEKSSFLKELLLILARKNRLPELITLLEKERPNVAWLPVPKNFELPEVLLFEGLTTAGDTNIGQIGDIFNVGDISGSYTAIGNGAQVIVNHIEQALSAVEEMEKGIQVAESRLARAIQTKIETYTRLPTTVGAEAYRNPYRSLLNYRIEDAPYFYGRHEAIREMLIRLDRNRLTVLQSDSGSGKTSLLQAGLAARLLAAKHLPLYVRPYKEPPQKAIKRAFLPDYQTLEELERFRDEKMSLAGFLRRVTSYLGPRKLFIFLDQFEEFFNDLTPEKETFARELHQCIDDSQLDVGWVLALREEYFAKLRLFEAVKPFENWYFLNTFRVEEAREVIIQPASKMKVTYEDGLVDHIIEDVSNGSKSLIPVHVQLVCTALFDERHQQPESSLISYDLYNLERGEGENKASGAKGILRSHLNRTVKQQMAGRERQMALQILRALVTSDKHRAQRSRQSVLNELQAISGDVTVEESTFDTVLIALENNRLIRADEDDQGEIKYELVHDYLLGEIEVDPQFQAIKLAQEILSQELPFYIDRGILLAQDKFNIVHSQRDFLSLDNESQELLRFSEAYFVRIQEQEKRRAQEETKQKEKLLTQERSVNRRNRIIIAIVSTIALTLGFNTFIWPKILRVLAADYDKFSNLVQVPLDNGKAFEIEAYEVSNERYARCIEAGMCNRPNGFPVVEGNWEEARLLPVVGVNAYDAMAFCQWIGRTLPTIEQWDEAVIPDLAWASMEDSQAVYCRKEADEEGCWLKPVGGRQISQNPSGLPIYDLTGNASEWTRTVFERTEKGVFCQDVAEFPSGGKLTIIAGDAFSTKIQNAGSYTTLYSDQGFYSFSSSQEWGFRCAVSSEETTQQQELLSYPCPSSED